MSQAAANASSSATASSSSSGGGSTAFSRLSRPGSGRLLTASGGEASSSWDRSARSGSGRSSASLSSSSTPASLSPTSPMAPAGGSGGGSGGGLVPEHRIRPLPGGLTLPSPGGGLLGRVGNTAGPDGVTSPEQQERRQGLKISFSTPNFRKAAALTAAGGGGGGGLQPQAPPRQATAGVPPSSSMSPLLAAAASSSSSSRSTEERGKLLMYSTTHSTGRLIFGAEGEFDFKAEDLSDEGEIGRGAFGTVNKMSFSRNKFRKVMAVKRIRSTVDEREQKELLMDLDVVMRSNDCPYIVLFFGAIFKEGDCWICMEMMATSTDKFYKFIYDQLAERIPEKVIGKITVATVKALNYLKDKLQIIHRDVKPSNILLDRGGNIKLCDFGISGQLVDSIAKTRDAGCRPYMAPERIDPQRAKGYDVRSDVWSLGITLIELATGCFPYPKWNSVFEQLQQVVHGDPPRLDRKNAETVEFVNFVNTCLIKEDSQRPKYTRLLEHPFIKRSDTERVDVADYVTCVLERWDDTAMDVETA